MARRRVLISADMEGISGVVSAAHTRPSHGEYARFRKLMTADVNAAIEGALAGGGEEVLVCDSHGPMSNILIEDLHPRAELIAGNPRPLGMMSGVDAGVEGVFLVGYHARSGTAQAILEHTISLATLNVTLNGRAVGELGLNAAIAGSFDVPVLLVTGDRAVAKEAQKLLGEVETAVVKEGITRTAARCLQPEIARERIQAAAQRAMAIDIDPLVVSPPVRMRVQFHRAEHADGAMFIPGATRINGRTVEWTGNGMPEVYRTLHAMIVLAGATRE